MASERTTSMARCSGASVMSLTFGRRRPSWNGTDRTLTAPLCRSGDRFEEENRGRKSVEVVGASHRPDLPGAGHTGHRGGTKLVHQKGGIVARRTEQVAPSTITRESECSSGTSVGETIFQIGRGGFCVPNLELHRGADGHCVTDRQCPGGSVDTHDRPYKEVTGTEDLYVLIDDDPEMEAVSDPGSRRFIGRR